MKAFKIFAMFISFMVQFPIWVYIMYRLLKAVNADSLLWFLFWVYLPAGIVSSIIFKICELHGE